MRNEIVYVFSAYITDFIKLWLFFWGIIKLSPVKNKNVSFVVGIIIQRKLSTRYVHSYY